ncbi:PfkB family carbohydrate kinase [Capillimicrobium parvum]|uniref:Bifunctional protein HldE n=1 Tax=Capillimicrobium parvum TaxID=2884022 RepID=A0A9E7C0Q3_9ACTN|nr:PfkB family carbohydrate kinase [Capillimicrobium parvum]UGS35772.1 Bifunctional protein HldE [Capillimicrobium parvum]
MTLRPRAPLVVVGDTLLDRDIEGRAERLAPDAPAPVVDEQARRARPGGAGLSAALAAGDGRPVTLITALARDAGGDELRELLRCFGVEVVDLGLAGTTPEKIRVRAGGRALLRLDRGDGGEPGPVTASGRSALTGAAAVLVSDYGRGLAARADVRAALAALDPDVPVVWDPHPRGPAPVPGARLVTPNAAEAAREVPEPAGRPQGAVAEAAARGAELARRWRAVGACVTLGERGAVLAFAEGTPLAVPARSAAHGDPCGAGDRFASALAALLADGELPSSAVGGAVAVASAFVAAGGAGAVRAETETEAEAAPGAPEDPRALAHRVRAAGGTVVVTGGCFDLLHAGHAAMLGAARSLGDCLIVCLNSDRSVRRLKGAGRPVVREDDRAALLRALACVDAVAVFDEDVPERVLRDLRPHLFVKGGDYHAAELPEAATLAEWGGRAVTVPFVAGRSTSKILEEVALRGA